MFLEEYWNSWNHPRKISVELDTDFEVKTEVTLLRKNTDGSSVKQISERAVCSCGATQVRSYWKRLHSVEFYHPEERKP